MNKQISSKLIFLKNSGPQTNIIYLWTTSSTKNYLKAFNILESNIIHNIYKYQIVSSFIQVNPIL